MQKITSYRKNRFPIFHGSVVTQARRSETFWCCEMQRCKIIEIGVCKSCCKKFAMPHFFESQCM